MKERAGLWPLRTNMSAGEWLTIKMKICNKPEWNFKKSTDLRCCTSAITTVRSAHSCKLETKYPTRKTNSYALLSRTKQMRLAWRSVTVKCTSTQRIFRQTGTNFLSIEYLKIKKYTLPANRVTNHLWIRRPFRSLFYQHIHFFVKKIVIYRDQVFEECLYLSRISF